MLYIAFDIPFGLLIVQVFATDTGELIERNAQSFVNFKGVWDHESRFYAPESTLSKPN